jgi:hypothetical protein
MVRHQGNYLCWLQNPVDRISLRVGDRVKEKTTEWNLGFAFDEVIMGLEKLLTGSKYDATRSEVNGESHFLVTLVEGSLTLIARPLLSHASPFSPLITLYRTLLTIICTDVPVQDEEIFFRRLTLTFLRAGG